MIFCDKVTHSVEEGKAVVVVYLDVSKAFDTITHSILLEKLTSHGLDRFTVCWEKIGCMSRLREWWSMELHPAAGWS